MYKTINREMGTIIFIFLFFISCQKMDSAPLELQDHETRVALLNRAAVTDLLANNVHVFATGLNNPRGLKFGPDGNLYVAEGGLGGNISTASLCEQVIFPVGPYTASLTGGRISKITPAGVRTTIADNFPSSQANEIIGGDVSGVADVEFVGNTLYAILAGAGCSHGVSSVPNGIVKVNSNGTWSLIANLSAFQQSHPVAHAEEEDFEPDGTWYSMINVRNDLYAIEPNHGEMVKVTTAGIISRVVDISASQGHIVPTSIVYKGNFFVGNLNLFPIKGGASKILKITPDGSVKDWITDLNTVLGLVIDKNNRTYVLEMTSGAPYPTPGLGRIIRIDPEGSRTIIATGLSLPTGMTMGPEGKLYVSNWGFGPVAAGGGQILQVDVN